MAANRFHRAIQCRHRIIGKQKPDARVVIGAALAIEGVKTVEPCARTTARADANLHREDLRRQLVMAFEILEQGPEVRNRVCNSLRVIGIRRSTRQRLFKSLAGSGLPKGKVLPEQVVESPDQTGTDWSKRLEVNALLRTGGRIGGIVQRADEFFFERLRPNLPQVHADFDPRQHFFGARRPANRDGFPKIRFVLKGFEMHVQVFENSRWNLSLACGGHKHRGHTGGKRRLLLRNMVDVDNHLEKTRTALYTTN